MSRRDLSLSSTVHITQYTAVQISASIVLVESKTLIIRPMPTRVSFSLQTMIAKVIVTKTVLYTAKDLTS